MTVHPSSVPVDSRRPHDPRAEHGYALITVMGVSFVLLALVMAVFTNVDGAASGVAKDARTKSARGAADAGVAFYASRLAADPDYWKGCVGTSADTDPVFSGATGTRRWKAVDGGALTTDKAVPAYTIEVLPVAGQTACVRDTPSSIFEPTSNSFRIRVTGRSGDDRRSVIASFRRGSLLEYLYLTNYETTDPELYPEDQRQLARDYCGGKYWPQRPVYNGAPLCSDIQFAPADVIDGPLHSNDRLTICGSPRLGRSGDAVESSQNPGVRTICGASSTRVTSGAGTIDPPATVDGDLSTVAQSSESGRFYLKGKTEITLAGDRLTAKDSNGKTLTNVALPTKGVVYVDGNGCSPTLNPRTVDYTKEQACEPLARVKGTANRDLTIASKGDIIVTGDLRAGPDRPLIGLAAENYVRIAHPVRITTGTNGKKSTLKCENATGTNQDITVDAAILALTHGFVVDNWGPVSYWGDADEKTDCARLGTLTVTGAIIQNYRGPVGTPTNAGTGYTKNYVYEDRLQLRNPPFFPQPQGSVWRVVRATEQMPAADPTP